MEHTEEKPTGTAKWHSFSWVSMLCLPVLFIYFEVMLRITGSQPLTRHLQYPLVFGISAGLFFAALFSFLPVKADKILTAVLLGIFGVLFTTECMIKNNFQAYMDLPSVLGGAQNVLKEYGNDLFSAIFGGAFKILLFLFPMLFYLIFGKKLKLQKTEKLKLPLSFAGLFGAVGLYVMGSLFVHFGNENRFYAKQYDFNLAVENFGLFTGLRLSAKDAFSGKPDGGNFILDVASNDSEIVLPTVKPRPEPATEPESESTEPSKPVKPVSSPEVYGDNILSIDFDKIYNENTVKIVSDLNNYVQSQKPSNKNEYTGIFEGKNLILICAEAFSDAAVSEELTPTLYRMMHNGIYFSEYYQPLWGGSTSTGEFSFLMGLVPHSGMTSMQKTQYNNNYFSLGNQMQRQGYRTCAYHNGNYDFYNRHLTHENLGYDHFIAYGSGMDELVERVNYRDSVMIDVTFDRYVNEQPFCLYYLTISGHSSYHEESGFVKLHYSRVKSVFPERYQEKTLYYLSYQYELETALTLLLEKLEEAGIADDTVICLTADHYPYGLDKGDAYDNDISYVADLYGSEFWQPWDRDRNAWILWSGSLENELKDYACEVSSPTYSLDIVPTLSNLFGLPYDSRLLVGRDVFSEQMPLVVWNTYNWVTEAGYYNAGSGRFYPKEGYTYNKEYISQINNKVHNIVEFSYQVVDNNYYGILFGPDTDTGKNEITAEAETESESESESESDSGS